MLLEHCNLIQSLFGRSDLRGQRIPALLYSFHRLSKCLKIICAGEPVLLIIQKRPGLLFGNLILDRQIIVMSSPLILFCLQRTDKLGFLFCQRAAAFSRIMDTPA